MIQLRPGQIEVNQYRNGVLAVPAVPGAGKTTCLCHLACKLIADGLPPGKKILIVTVMNSAVSNFKHKMRTLLETQGLQVKGFEVKTLHSLGLLILQENPEKILVNSAFDLLDQTERDRIIQGLCNRWLSANRDRWKGYLTKNPDERGYSEDLNYWSKGIMNMIASTITSIKLQGYSFAELESIKARVLSDEEDSFLKWTFEIMGEYDRHIRNLGRVDFDDLIVLAYRLLLDDSEIRERLQDRWAFVFEDEAQDSTPLQEKLLKILSEKSGNLLRVGDVNQGIMGFTGTDSALFARFCEEVDEQPISVASRSTQEIMDFANHFVRWVRNYFPLIECRDALCDQMITGTDPGDPFPNPQVEGRSIAVREYMYSKQEFESIANMAANVAERYPDKTLAILAYQNRFLKEIEGYIKNAEYEYTTEGLAAEQRTLYDVQAILTFIGEPSQKKYLWDVVEQLIVDVEPEELEQIKEVLRENQPEDLLYPNGDFNIENIPQDLLGSGAWHKVENIFKDLRRWLEYSHIQPDELVLQIASELSMDKDQRELVNNYAGQISRLLKNEPGTDLYSIIKSQELNRNVGLAVKNLRDRHGYSPRPGVISLATMHKSKGLEWDIVFVVGIATDQFPESLTQYSTGEILSVKREYRYPNAIALAQLKAAERGETFNIDPIIADQAKCRDISENLRLIYVAITRAKERLVVSTHAKKNNGRDLPPSSIFMEMKRFVERNG